MEGNEGNTHGGNRESARLMTKKAIDERKGKQYIDKEVKESEWKVYPSESVASGWR